jgi:hypothetical protein
MATFERRRDRPPKMHMQDEELGRLLDRKRLVAVYTELQRGVMDVLTRVEMSNHAYGCLLDLREQYCKITKAGREITSTHSGFPRRQRQRGDWDDCDYHIRFIVRVSLNALQPATCPARPEDR